MQEPLEQSPILVEDGGDETPEAATQKGVHTTKVRHCAGLCIRTGNECRAGAFYAVVDH